MADGTVFKIVSASEWNAAEQGGAYAGSADDARDGFIHLSSAEQVAGTAHKHFSGRDGLLLIAFRCRDIEARLPGKLKFEPSRDGALFPHLYAPLPCDLEIARWPMPLGPEGIPLVPDGLDRAKG